MPRTQRSAAAYISKTPKFDSPFQIDSGSFSTGSLDFPHALFAPLHYTSGYAYPLIVWLHGAGSDERQLLRIMPLISMQNFVAVAPQGIALPETNAPKGKCLGWQQTDGPFQQAEQRVFSSVELADQKFHIDQRRVFIAGFDAGGTMALRLAMSNPNRFAGVLSLCGAFPTGVKPFGNLIAARRLGVFLASGRASTEYPAEQVCNDLRLLHTAGLSVTLRQYPCGHELQPQMLSDINRWVMEQIAPPPSSDEKSDAQWLHEAE
jgi:phospholipase/carboxylesterase